MMVHLLRKVNPLVFLHYPAIFQSGNYKSLHFSTMRLALLFIIMDRNNYNKSSLSWISENDFHRENLPG